MNEFNVLLNAATNGTPSGSLFDALFARYIAPQEEWRELESPLPITILAAGEDLIDYRIYGNTEDGESVGERTENLFDKNSEDNLHNHSIRKSTGEIVVTNFYTATHKINVTGGQSYVSEIFDPGTVAYIYVVEYDEDDQFVKSTGLTTVGGTASQVITLDATTAYVRMSLLTTLLRKLIFVPGSTAPTSYIPYGYQLPMVVTNGTATTTTPIYIGSDPLAEDEYVDFGEQKIYRMVNGNLTPTDPPVPIPALPTIRGETIIDYNPSETPAVEPEKMYIKYKPQ